jgi:hypothetical protein
VAYVSSLAGSPCHSPFAAAAWIVLHPIGSEYWLIAIVLVAS